MEAINYVVDGNNMVLTEDAQIVQGVSGNGCYLPAGVGTIALPETAINYPSLFGGNGTAL